MWYLEPYTRAERFPHPAKKKKNKSKIVWTSWSCAIGISVVKTLRSRFHGKQWEEGLSPSSDAKVWFLDTVLFGLEAWYPSSCLLSYLSESWIQSLWTIRITTAPFFVVLRMKSGVLLVPHCGNGPVRRVSVIQKHLLGFTVLLSPGAAARAAERLET